MTRWRVLGIALLLFGVRASAQPPGTQPPPSSESVKSDASGTSVPAESSRLPVEAFLFLDETGAPVLRPGMSWEQYEQARTSIEDADRTSRIHDELTVRIEGQAEETRAEFRVIVDLKVAATQDRRVELPLQMENFHPVGEIEVRSTPRQPHRVLTDLQNGGLVLSSRTTEASRVRLEIPVAARVQQEGRYRQIRFDLPDASSMVSLDVPPAEVNAEVIGLGDEVVSQTPRRGGSAGDASTSRGSRILVESAGGAFVLRWTAASEQDTSEMLLDVQTQARARWTSPSDQPDVTAELNVQNRRASLQSFELVLPAGALLLDAPSAQVPGDEVEVDLVNDDRDESRWTVQIPQDVRTERVVVTVNYRLGRAVDPDRTADTEKQMDTGRERFAMRLPQVPGAIRHSGRLLIDCNDDYRLRWVRRLSIQSVVPETANQSSTRRTYAFAFDRGDFELPVWLAAKQRQLRLSSETQLSLHDSALSAVMTVRPSGQAMDGRGLKIDLTGWQVRLIAELESGAAMDWFTEQGIREIEMAGRGGSGPVAFQIQAVHPLPPDADQIDVMLPKIIENDESTIVSSSMLRLTGEGRRSLIVDLDASTGLDRVNDGGRIGILDEGNDSSYRVLPTEDATRLVASIVQQPQRITLISDSKVEIDGNYLTTSVDWSINSKFDLDGRLPVRIQQGSTIPEFLETFDEDGDDGLQTETSDAFAESLDRAEVESEPSGWTVTIDGTAAALRHIEADRYELISQRLTAGAKSIRWYHSQPIRSLTRSMSSEAVALPRPDTDEVIVQGMIRVALIGDRTTELVAADGSDRTQLEFDVPPRDPIRLQLQNRARSVNQTFVRRAVIRSVLGNGMRHEQVFASVDGGQVFRLHLPNTVDTMSATAKVDGQNVTTLRRGNFLELRFPPGEGTRSVELRLWIPSETSVLANRVQPVIRIADGVERVYWQVIAPSDQHLVWASPTISRAMQWRFDRWRLRRRPTMNGLELAEWVGAMSWKPPPVGNEYLYLGNSVPSFAAILVSRSVLWLIVGSLVLTVAALLTYAPRLRHPLSAVAAAVVLTGLLLITPDAAVLTGQWFMVALVLLVVMTAVRTLMRQPSGTRVLVGPRRGGLSAESTSDRSTMARGKPTASLPAPAAGSSRDAEAGGDLSPSRREAIKTFTRDVSPPSTADGATGDGPVAGPEAFAGQQGRSPTSESGSSHRSKPFGTASVAGPTDAPGDSSEST